MSYPQRQDVSVTTAADGTATAYSSVITGIVVAIIYTKDDFVNGVDFTITAETTGQNLWTDTNINASETVNPIVAANTQDGAASTTVFKEICLANERVKIVIAQGGNVTSGTFTVITR